MSFKDVTDLSNLAPGETGTVTSLAGGRRFVGRLAALGLTPGGEVSMAQNFGHGPVIIRIRGARIALGRGEAQKVQVRKRIERG